MKTTLTNINNNLKRLTKVLGIGALISLGLKANAQCLAQFTYNNDTVNSGNVFFVNASTIGNAPLTYSWSFGDGTASNLENPNHIFANNGNSVMMVCLTVADANGIVCTYCDSVFIGSQPSSGCLAYFTSEADTSSSNSINFWDYSGGSPTSFSWDFGDNTTSSLESPNHVYAAAGTYHVCLTISDSVNNCQNTNCEDIFVGNQNGGCQAYFYSVPDSIAANGIDFMNSSGGAANSFLWDFGDGTSSALENPNHIFASQGTYQVCLTIADSGMNCQNTYCEYVNIGQNGNACQANFYSYTDSISSNSINFVNYSAGTPYSYSWDFGDNTTSSLENPNHVYANSGTYLVCLTVADSNGFNGGNGTTGSTCSYCEYVYVGQTTNGCQAYFYSYTDSSSVNSINFWNYSAGTSTSYSWDFGDNTTSSLENPNHIFADGAYQVCLTIGDSSGITCSYCENIVVGNGGCQAYFYSAPDSSLVNGINFSNYSGGTPNSYFWDFGDSTTTSNSGAPNHVYADSGKYYACLTIVAQNGAICTYCDSVVARNLVIAGVKESKNINTVLGNYPNPFNGSTTINYSISKEAAVELSISDLIGNKIAAVESGNKSAGKYSTVWNAENVSNGMYLLQLKVNDQVSTKKIIIAK